MIVTEFSDFFRAVWHSESWPDPEPFPWQRMLAKEVAGRDWPEVITLPVASGKTACLDIAVFAIAVTAKDRKCQMPRRVWFVVDRRTVIDEAYERACKIARKLLDAIEGPAKTVADRLRQLSGTRRPLAVGRLQGGAWRDDGWARIPSQPAIICSTVDQIGSALLFRAYGHGDNTASIFAGLAAHDSLILLDEAHCAVPFLQTLRAIARFRCEPWADADLKAPFRFSIMSATPSSDIVAERFFPCPPERVAALDHPLLQNRIEAKKMAKLVLVKSQYAQDDDPFVFEVVSQVKKYIRTGEKRPVAVMVNRVSSAGRISNHLRNEMRNAADIVLLTGRLRPLDRDTLLNRWMPVLKAGSKTKTSKPVVVVSTQCLEVGADFSFGALVTECASLDALRQRFGRLDRLGEVGESPATILARNTDVANDATDPIYGSATLETWRWLQEKQSAGIVDFGIAAVDKMVEELQCRDRQRLRRLLFPSPEAPVLLPAHLDLLCQTWPRPTPEPDITFFLHGKEHGQPEVQVLFRADLPDPQSEPLADDIWIDTLSLVRPTSPEMWTVPLYGFRRWLTTASVDVSGDVEGTLETQDEEIERGSARCPFLLWRGRSLSKMTKDCTQIRPGDILVLQSTLRNVGGFVQIPESPDGLGPERLDLAERAQRLARGRVVLRVHRSLLTGLSGIPAFNQLLDFATSPEVDRDKIETALQNVLDESAVFDGGAVGYSALPLPGWLVETIRLLLEDGFRLQAHPAGGLILFGKKWRPLAEESELELLADEDDLTSRWRHGVTLRQHTADVQHVAADFVAKCFPPHFSGPFVCASQGHDLGKLDRRFQLLLRDGDETSDADEPLAKSATLPESRLRHQEISENTRLPPGFRHELLSMQLTEYCGVMPQDGMGRDLTLHLIASHHGYVRPFAPVVIDRLVEDGHARDLDMRPLGIESILAAAERKNLIPAHRLDSEVSDRFWRLTRRFGWWGLAYLEAVFRLADRTASNQPGIAAAHTLRVAQLQTPHRSPHHNVLSLEALDGANPLAFLAALGTLRIMTRLLPDHDFRLNWQLRSGAWRPTLHSRRAIDRDQLISVLNGHGLPLGSMFSSELVAESLDLRFNPKTYRQFCAASSLARDGELACEYAATWASEMEDPKDPARVRKTAFHFTAGNQRFVDMIMRLRKTCSKDDLLKTLFDGWQYTPNSPSLRWDPTNEKRQYALQAVAPTNASTNPPLAELGANFLAVEGLPLFPVVPDRWASQPGLTRNGGKRWSWPIWAPALSLDEIRSLLTIPFAEWAMWRRTALGVVVVFQTRIVQPSGRYRCFTPARAI